MSIFDRRELNKVANDKVAVEEAYDKAWVTARELTPRLPVDRFWEIMEILRSDILDVDRYYASKYACDELFRRCVINQLVVGGTPVTFDELVSFIESWQAVTAALIETLFNVVNNKSDDGYNDLCDSLPLIGRKGVTFLLSLDADNNDSDTVKMAIKNDRPLGCEKGIWMNLIWEGENYWRMYLEDEAKRRYPRQAINHTPKTHTETLV